MNAAALLETWMDAGTKIDNLWSMYIVVHLGLFWFFFLVHRPLLIVERIMAIGAYMGFGWINGNALIHSYNFLEAVRTDLIAAKLATEFSQASATLTMLKGADYAGRDELILLTHGGAFTLVLVLFLLRNIMIRRYFAAYPDQFGKQSGLTD
jgi:hypothetical protein